MAYDVLLQVKKIRAIAEELLPFMETNDDLEKVKKHVEDIGHCVQFIVDKTEVEGIHVFSARFSRHLSWLNRRTDEGKPRQAESDVVDMLERDIEELRNGLLRYYGMEDKHDLINLEEIGRGAFAKVYKGYDLYYDRPVALKEMHSPAVLRELHGVEGEDFLNRFKREVKLMESFDHPNILPIIEAELTRAPYWIKMPLADCSLYDWVMNNPKSSDAERLRLFKQILYGVQYLHDLGKYHRDLAPSNILLFDLKQGKPLIHIADFGLAKDMQSVSFQTGLSVNGFGHAEYTSPEQYQSLANADHLDDIFSLGGILYFLLSGKSPNNRISHGISYQRIVDKAMKQHKEDRFQSITDFLFEIDEAIRREERLDRPTFRNLQEYVYTNDDTFDVKYITDQLVFAKEQTPETVYFEFIMPFISIPKHILKLCIQEHEGVMVPFLQLLKKNLDQFYIASSDELYVWNEIAEILYFLSDNCQSEPILYLIIEQILINACFYKHSSAQRCVPQVISSIPKQSLLAKRIANLIEDEFNNYKSLLSERLQGVDYPMEIRFVINDY